MLGVCYVDLKNVNLFIKIVFSLLKLVVDKSDLTNVRNCEERYRNRYKCNYDIKELAALTPRELVWISDMKRPVTLT